MIPGARPTAYSLRTEATRGFETTRNGTIRDVISTAKDSAPFEKFALAVILALTYAALHDSRSCSPSMGTSVVREATRDIGNAGINTLTENWPLASA